MRGGIRTRPRFNSTPVAIEPYVRQVPPDSPPDYPGAPKYLHASLPVPPENKTWKNKLIHKVFKRKKSRENNINQEMTLSVQTQEVDWETEEKEDLMEEEEVEDNTKTSPRRRFHSWAQGVSSSQDLNMLFNNLSPKAITTGNRLSEVQVVGEYILGEEMGEGASVFVAFNTNTGHKAAVKVVDKNNVRDKDVKRARKEYSIMSQLNHKYIVSLIDLYESASFLFIIMELGTEGDLFDYMKNFERGIPQQEAARLFYQILVAVRHVHQQGFVHRDIKPENVFLDDDKNVLLGDFGYATSWSRTSQKKKGVGSLHYASPEIINATGTYMGPEVDSWSLGACLFTILTDSFPFGATDTRAIKKKILEGAW
eukprot:CAMPEP_0174250052 /NCGR_PEP_ID=MMETSP0439-20130205/347_1 /TAXON_ID=0 /ORGANISM="Stereomyxa ramosa, Strain Chinc5" /LENGTH=367 /DNA_ID=CAMNT_0015330025 /DNA_START=79 /DNA_END=1179 /DNA_ORIENTATION=+